MNKRGVWGFAEFWTWVAMFIIIFVFLILFKGCSGPTIQRVQAQQLDAIAARQETLVLLQTPTMYRGQNVTLAYLISLGTVPAEYDKVSLPIQQALLRTLESRSIAYALDIVYPGRTVHLAQLNKVPLDSARIPSPNGEDIKVTVGRALSLEDYRKALLDFARTGGRYLSGDGRVWVAWPLEDSPITGASWSEEGLPCATTWDGKRRTCVDGTIPKGPPACFVQDDGFVNGRRVERSTCENAMGGGSGPGTPTASEEARKQFVTALMRIASRREIGSYVKDPNVDGKYWTFWFELTGTGGGAINDRTYWSSKDFCDGGKVERDTFYGGPHYFGRCESGLSGETLWRTNEKDFVTTNELVKVFI